MGRIDYYGTHTGVSVGSTTSGTLGWLDGVKHAPSCPQQLRSPTGGANVKPTISGPNTLWWFKGLSAGVSGYANQITLTANSGGNGTSFQWAITAGSDKVSLSTSSSAAVQVTSIGQSITANDVSITVTVGGITSSPFKLTVRAPYTLGSDPQNPTPLYASDGTWTWRIIIYYQILDNFLTPIPSPVSINENWTTGITPDYQGENWPPRVATCGETLNSAPAETSDFIQGEPNTVGYQPTPVYNTQQNGAAVYHWGQEFRIGTCAIGAGPRVQTDTLQFYVDHAAHLNIVSPAP